MQSLLERKFLHGWESYADPSLPAPVPEHRFHPQRLWRWDYAWPDLLLAVDIQGGTFGRGRHSRGRGQTGDHEKMNAATMLGWRFLQFSTVDLTNKALPHTIALTQELVNHVSIARALQETALELAVSNRGRPLQSRSVAKARQ